jgi:hypothetical protein
MAESVTEVPGATVPVELEVVVVVVPTPDDVVTWKHSLVVVVDDEPVNPLVSGVYTADQQ